MHDAIVGEIQYVLSRAEVMGKVYPGDFSNFIGLLGAVSAAST